MNPKRPWHATLGTRLWRWLSHAATTPLAVRRAFPPRVLKSVGAAIELAEAGHTGEIRFVIEGSLPWAFLRRNAPVRRRALALFSELRVWDTEHNNGILIYIELADRAVEIVADREIARRVDPQVWHRICHDLKEHCRSGQYEAGAVGAVRELGALLQREFALAPGQARTNELPDRPLTL
ncbi:MAG TPA: TPM domain-containing protein [Burkholderiaceae bacterium]|nr:TPM domain-containing protein [Burkholderiaceae bacterium]